MKIFGLLLSLFLCYSTAYSIDDDQEEGRTTRLSEGSDASPGFFPYVAEIKLKNVIQCVGVIISENWILTAAHCLWYHNIVSPEDLSVRVGAVNWLHPEEASYVVSIDRHVIHSDWTIYPKYVNNIALLHVKEPLRFSDIVQAAHLADQSKPIDMSIPATVAGWGGNNSHNTPDDILQYSTKFKLIDNTYCSYEEITPNSICTNSTSPNPTSCFWDKGAPLLQLDSTIGMVLYGLVSYAGCSNNLNTFYESIVNHRVWIHLVSGV